MGNLVAYSVTYVYFRARGIALLEWFLRGYYAVFSLARADEIPH